MDWNIQTCWSSTQLGAQCALLSVPNPWTAPTYACALNQFCNDSGKVLRLKKSLQPNQRSEIEDVNQFESIRLVEFNNCSRRWCFERTLFMSHLHPFALTGRCQSMQSSPLYNRTCASGADCGPGLHCLRGRCAICSEGISPPFVLRDDVGASGETYLSRY